MKLRCRLGLHSWKRVAVRREIILFRHVIVVWDGGDWSNGWHVVAKRCRCCGKRVPA